MPLPGITANRRAKHMHSPQTSADYQSKPAMSSSPPHLRSIPLSPPPILRNQASQWSTAMWTSEHG